MAENGAGSAQDSGEDDVVQNLKRQVSDAQKKIKTTEEARRAESSGRQKAEGRLVASERQRFVDNEVAVDNIIYSHEQLLSSLEADLAAAIGAGDSAAQAKVHRNITTAQTRLDNAKGQKAQIEAIKKQGGPIVQPVGEDGEDPRLAQYPPTTRAWIKKHPQFLTDDAFKRKALALHTKAVDLDGIALESPEYFEAIERGLGLRRAAPRRGEARGGGVDFDAGQGGDDDRDPVSGASDVDDPEPTTSTGGRSNRRAADSGDDGGPGHSGDSVTLSAEQREVAQFAYPDEWAKDPKVAIKMYTDNLRVLKREGRLGTGH